MNKNYPTARENKCLLGQGIEGYVTLRHSSALSLDIVDPQLAFYMFFSLAFSAYNYC